jgi:hypothetical protein
VFILLLPHYSLHHHNYECFISHFRILHKEITLFALCLLTLCVIHQIYLACKSLGPSGLDLCWIRSNLTTSEKLRVTIPWLSTLEMYMTLGIYSKTCSKWNHTGPNVFSTLAKFPHYTNLGGGGETIKIILHVMYLFMSKNRWRWLEYCNLCRSPICHTLSNA